MPEPTDNVPLVKLSAVLAPNGLAIRVTAPKFEEFFSSLSPAPTIASEREFYGGARFYQFNTRFDGFTTGDIQNWGERRLLLDGRPNISLLRAVGIKDGVDITIQTVLNKRQLEEYFLAFEAAATEFYAEYIRPERYELEIICTHSTERGS